MVPVGLRDTNGKCPRQAGGEQSRGEQQHVLNRADDTEPRGYQEPGEPEPEGVVEYGPGREARDQDHTACRGRAFGADAARPGPARGQEAQRPSSAMLADTSGTGTG